MEPTFILTAEMDPASFAWLDGLRHEHFPPERNLLPAHLTLFHRLTPIQTTRLSKFALPTAPIALRFERIRLLGRGVAVAVECAELARLRTALRTTMADALSRQDSQGWRAHVTIQNKVTDAAARHLAGQLEDGFEPRAGAATGLLLWEYLGGPWRLERRLGFGAAAHDVANRP